MNAHRQVDLHGSISAVDAAGRTLRIRCAGAQLTFDADSVRAALAAFSTLRANGAVIGGRPRAVERLNDFRIELCVRGQPVGRAGEGARVNWLARIVTNAPLELRPLALLKAGLTAF